MQDDILSSITRQTINYSLEHIQKTLASLGNPQNYFKSIHITGTNGKGTTAYALSSILYQAGYKVGTFLSPHLLKVNERIKINLKDVSDTVLEEYVKRLKPYLANLTYFEALTLIAFVLFKETGVDYAVVEVGLGGRLDATNVLTPVLSVITSISKDHTQYLGRTIEKIALEKAGIIKPHIPVIVGRMSKAARKIIQLRAREAGSGVYSMGVDFRRAARFEDMYHWELRVEIGEQHYKMSPRISGSWQADNLAVAVFCAHLLGVRKDAIVSGVEEISVFPGRLEVLKQNPLVVYDVAHNPAAVSRLLKFWFKYHREEDSTLIMGFMQDKDIHRMLKLVDKFRCEKHYLGLKYERSWKPQEYNLPMLKPQEIGSVIKRGRYHLIFGSFYIYREIIQFLDGY